MQMLFGERNGLRKGKAASIEQSQRPNGVLPVRRRERKMLLPVLFGSVVLFLSPRFSRFDRRELLEQPQAGNPGRDRDAVGQAAIGTRIPVDDFPDADCGAGGELSDY